MDFIIAQRPKTFLFPEKVFGSLDATRPLLLSLTESSEYASVRDLDGWFRFPDHVTGLGSLCVNITQHGQSAYRLLLLDTKKDLSDSEGFLLEFSCRNDPSRLPAQCDAENLAGAVASHRAAPCPRRPDGRLYCGQPGSRCARLAFPPHLLLPLSAALRYGSENLTANSVCAYLENILTGCSAFPHGGGIVAFFNLTLSDFSMTDLMERMVHFVEDSSLMPAFRAA